MKSCGEQNKSHKWVKRPELRRDGAGADGIEGDGVRVGRIVWVRVRVLVRMRVRVTR